MCAWFVSLLLAIHMEVRGKNVGVLISGVERKTTHESNTVGIVYCCLEHTLHFSSS